MGWWLQNSSRGRVALFPMAIGIDQKFSTWWKMISFHNSTQSRALPPAYHGTVGFDLAFFGHEVPDAINRRPSLSGVAGGRPRTTQHKPGILLRWQGGQQREVRVFVVPFSLVTSRYHRGWSKQKKSDMEILVCDHGCFLTIRSAIESFVEMEPF